VCRGGEEASVCVGVRAGGGAYPPPGCWCVRPQWPPRGAPSARQCPCPTSCNAPARSGSGVNYMNGINGLHGFMRVIGVNGMIGMSGMNRVNGVNGVQGMGMGV